MHLKLLIEKFKKLQKKNGDLIGNKMANKITKVSQTSPPNNLETVTNEKNNGLNREIPTES